MFAAKAGSSGKLQGLNGGEHLALEILIMKVQRMHGLGRTATFGMADTSQHRFERFLAQHQHTRQGANTRSAHAGFDHLQPGNDIRAFPIVGFTPCFGSNGSRTKICKTSVADSNP